MTTAQDEALGDAELESAAGAVIGKIVFAFSRFEFNLGLCLRNAVGGGDVDAVNPLIERLSFKHKLDAMLEVAEHKFASNAECVAEFKQWHRSIDALRAKRNSFGITSFQTCGQLGFAAGYGGSFAPFAAASARRMRLG